jgi:hypothetical protein
MASMEMIREAHRQLKTQISEQKLHVSNQKNSFSRSDNLTAHTQPPEDSGTNFHRSSPKL